jgi:histone H3/H4
VLEAKAEEVAKKAISLANHAKRKTLKKEDIAEAVKEL